MDPCASPVCLGDSAMLLVKVAELPTRTKESVSRGLTRKRQASCPRSQEWTAAEGYKSNCEETGFDGGRRPCICRAVE